MQLLKKKNVQVAGRETGTSQRRLQQETCLDMLELEPFVFVFVHMSVISNGKFGTYKGI